MRRPLVVPALAAILLAGCGEKHEPPAPRVTAVTGTVNLGRPGAPDAGTTAGHRPTATATTVRSSLVFSGQVSPPSSRVTLRPARGPAAPVAVGADGGFRARARKLKRGTNRFVLEARAAGLAPWTTDIAITRE